MNQNKQFGHQRIKTAMKPLVILMFLLLLSGGLRAQVGISADGSDPDNSAMLDVKSTNKGFLPPRVTLTATSDAATILSPAAGLLVYNTATTGDVSPGYYYFDGTAWVRIGTAGQASQWTSGGSSVYYNSGNVGIGSTAPISKLQVYGTETGANWAGWGVFGGVSNAVVLGQHNDKAVFGGHNAALNAWTDLLINPGGGKVSIGTTIPAASAALDVYSTSGGFLPPRMTLVQRDAIAAPASGLMVFCTDCGTGGALSLFLPGSGWITFSPCNAPTPVAGTHVPEPNQITWNWSPAAGVSGYRWNIVNDYSTSWDIGKRDNDPRVNSRNRQCDSLPRSVSCRS